MTELRRDPITRRWVIVKIKDFLTPQGYETDENVTDYFPMSPFIYGREAMTPPELDSIRQGSAPNTPGWTVRVVSNKFPALQIEGNIDVGKSGVYDFCHGIGAHEVIIETPNPMEQMADFSVEQIVHILTMYQNRCVDLAKDQRFKYILIFKNYGVFAGASIHHAHSQMIALPMIPKYIQEKLNGAEEFYKKHQRSIYSAMLEQEFKDRERIVTENQDFVSFCPFVQRYSFETCIYPKRTDSKFTAISSDEKRQLATILKEVLARMKECLGDPAFNFYLNIEPMNYTYEQTFLWHLEIIPKLSRFAEFDTDTGFHIIHTPPHEAARFLRNTAADK